MSFTVEVSRDLASTRAERHIRLTSSNFRHSFNPTPNLVRHHLSPQPGGAKAQTFTMARVAQVGARSAEPLVDEGDICPVCKSSRYLSKNMRFLINPECYHKMCESCVDRIFSHGPAPCPVAGCKRTLRKGKFRALQFSDLAIEREVDIRRRISRIFNKREDDFETLRAYNDYLGEVEDMTFNLLNGVDVEETQRKIEAYQAANKDDIAENAQLEEGEKKSFVARQAADQELARQRREAAAREAAEEQRERLEGRQDLLNKLASGKGSVKQILSDGRRAAQTRAARQDAPSSSNPSQAPAGSGSIAFAGLKKKVAKEAEKPYDPFGGYSVQQQFFGVKDDYSYEWFDLAKKDAQFNIGGYSLPEFYHRSLSEAFSGLGVFVANEVSQRDQSGSSTTATQGAATAAINSGRPLAVAVGNDVF